ncbi:MAG: hypothetical protein S4CHLAM6_01130 [Chlamydiae bacterium]|nr:hypothetical protein [Chlamydiota bacterium]
MKSKFLAPALLVFVFIVFSCVQQTDNRAPKHIINSQIIFDRDPAAQYNSANNNVHYVFSKDSEYKVYVNNRLLSSGRYTYKRFAENEAKLAIDLSDNAHTEVLLYLKFSTVDHGEFKSIPYLDEEQQITGSFQITYSGSTAFSQNEA